MAVSFASANSQKLVNSATPITTYPFSVGMWAFPTTSGVSEVFWSNADTGTSDFHYWRIQQLFSDVWSVRTSDAGASSSINIGTVTAGRWAYFVFRGIDATNQRFSVLQYDGSAVHGQNVVSRNPAGVDAMAFGCSNTSSASVFFDGSVAEFWCTATDVQADGGQLGDGFLRQLAFGGPFSVPHVAKDILEYRSFRKAPTSDGDDASEVYFGGAGRQLWTNTNGVTIGPHPPLPYWYVKPGQTQAELVI